MLNSSIAETKNAAQNATLGWKGALSTALIVVKSHLDIDEPVKKD